MPQSYPRAEQAPANLGSIDRIPLGEGRVFVVRGQEIAIVRTRSGDIHAVQARCPHRGGPLADGLVGAGRIVCPLHGHAFELATGEPLMHGCGGIRTYSVDVSADGEILLHLQSPITCAG